MREPENNKMISPEGDENIKNKTVKPAPSRFFYPDHQVTVEADSMEEADEELEKIIRNNR